MPELPEVETISRGLHQRIAGDVIDSVWIGRKPEPLKSPARTIAHALEGARIERVHRVGKHIVFELESADARKNPQFIVHLGMSGQLVVCQPSADHARHTHFIATLHSGRELRFVDPRRFGRLSVRESKPDDDHRWAGGSEPLDIGFELFAALFKKRKAPIKSALLNQKLLRGVGNIYADEALFRAGVRPRRRSASLTREQLHQLYTHLQAVLNEAIAAGGSSISDYVDAEGEEGQFQIQHRVYGREGEPCSACETPIKRIVISGRSAHYCPRCQK